jgi:hypothetical protein
MAMDVSVPDSSAVAQPLRYKQRLEKSTGGEVVLMEWSPTMDLLAIVLSDHSVRKRFAFDVNLKNLTDCIMKVVLNRLSWQRVWVISPSSAPVTAVAWRPDGRGKVLC